MENTDVIEKLRETVTSLKSRYNFDPQIGVTLGSGLGAFVKEIKVAHTVPYKDIPHFLPTTVVGHQGNLIFGTVGDKKIVALQGRNHYYEGHSMESVVFPTRVMGKLGVETLILTNSAGGFGDGMQGGDFMIIEDHINLTGTNPLLGPNLKELGPRFPDMTEAYDPQLAATLAAVFTKHNIRYHKGVYAGVLGPTYETPAEIRYLKAIGCHAVGMSTVPEAIAARHMGIKLAGVSCITNLAAGISKNKLTHEEVTETAKKVEDNFALVLKEFIESL